MTDYTPIDSQTDSTNDSLPSPQALTTEDNAGILTESGFDILCEPFNPAPTSFSTPTYTKISS